ncbi:NADH dehydrogenase [Alkaliphilus pronyensis]|uniref:NADH dehydrogenase n=1 Tax=Alkaliphilus pronyensis TaxID=1482732 RepID=A0A6I0FA32_9FIRM|nr:complex I subunit 5 family protein [Alkaliphilus pronyensis]KAB3534158.1 NADH dehydrogenase [Alkaliphilus pronyensis]
MEDLRLIILFWLPAVIIFFGLLEAIIIPLLSDNHRLVRRISVNAFIISTTILIMLTFNHVMEAPIIYKFDKVFSIGIFFKIDLLNYILMVFTGIIYTISSIYSLDDINHRDRERTFYFFYIITYITTIGTLMAGDLLSFFLFFEIMTFSSYALMVHYRGNKVLEAGNVYIYMGIIGGLSILSGIILLSAYTQSYEWINLAEKFSQMGIVKYVIGGLFIFGFGIKAGMVPFHFWLPKIYRESPNTVNAISSGILTKVGAYGILRVVTIIYSVNAVKASTANEVLWNTSANLGIIIIWLGIATMVVGVFLALLESNIKKMLAYHSISQMGYIIMGIGVAAYLGYQGAMGFSGSIYHMINHGLFKSLLFMVAGVVYIFTKELNMYKLGGLWRKMPFAAFVALVAVLAITGMPGLNGFASKTILHHGIKEAYEYGHPSFRYAELAFKVVSAGTVSSFIKFFGFIFMGECPPQYKNLKPKYTRMSFAMGALAIIIIIIGINPYMFLEKLIIPAVLSFTYDPEFVGEYIVGMSFWNMKNFMDTILVFGLGISFFIVGVKYHLFKRHIPRWINAEKLIFKPITKVCEEFPNMCVERYEKSMILGDVFIYVMLLTIILAAFIFTVL